MVRSAIRLAAFLALFSTVVSDATPAFLHAAGGPLNTPAGTVRYYFRALDSHQCDLAFKFAGQYDSSLRAFRRDCRAIRRVEIETLDRSRIPPASADGGIYLPGHPLHRVPAGRCGNVRRLVSDGADVWSGLAHSLLAQSLHPTRTRDSSDRSPMRDPFAIVCASERPDDRQRFRFPIRDNRLDLSQYLRLVCAERKLQSRDRLELRFAPTTVYRTVDAGRHWTALLHFTTTTGSVWIRAFMPNSVIVAATVGPLTAASEPHLRSALYSTRDGGRYWLRFPLPADYATEPGSISFPDSQRGWLWYGGGAAGSMSVYVYRTVDGGRRWVRVACSAFSNSTIGYGCSHPSGIGLGGDKGYLMFKDAHDGWLTVSDATGVLYLYHTWDGGTSWRRQAVGLPSGVAFPTANSTVGPFGTLFQSSFFGQIVACLRKSTSTR
jgi:photosystem II stability/assembly factor-like uncharacterized protein